jgi:hypothetical protein
MKSVHKERWNDSMTQIKLVEEFLNGATEGVCDGGRNLRIKGDQLIHFKTVIAERAKDKIILNVTRYSIQTGRVQKKLRESIEDSKLILVKQVPAGFNKSLAEMIEE